MSQDYAALIIDIKKSRSYFIGVRNDIQCYINDVIRLLNHLYRSVLVQEVDFSGGDEVQGLFSSLEGAYAYYRMTDMWLHPVGIRAGIGVGSWNVVLDGKGTAGQDGPAYHRARHAISHADDSEGYPVLMYSGGSADVTINTIIGGAASIAAKQSPYQNQLMLITEMLFPVFDSQVDADEAVWQEIEQLLKRKSKLAHDMEQKLRQLPFERLTRSFTDMTGPANGKEAGDKTEFYITAGKQRGIPTRLAGIMDIKRQSIEKAMKAGNVYTARNMAIAAINEMKQIRLER